MTRYRSIPAPVAIVRRRYTIPHLSPSPLLRRIFAPYALHVHASSFEYARIPGGASSLSPIMCKLYYFYPKYSSLPPRTPRPPGSTGQIAHVHRKSPPVSQPRSPPWLPPQRPPYLPRGSSLFSESHVYPHLASRGCDSGRFTTRFARFERKVGDFVTFAIFRARERRREGRGVANVSLWRKMDGLIKNVTRKLDIHQPNISERLKFMIQTVLHSVFQNLRLWS